MSRRRSSRKSNFDPQGFFSSPPGYSQRKGQTIRPKSSNLSSDGVRPSANNLEASRQLLIDYHYFNGSHSFVFDKTYSVHVNIIDRHFLSTGVHAYIIVDFSQVFRPLTLVLAELTESFNSWIGDRNIGFGSYIEGTVNSYYARNTSEEEITGELTSIACYHNSSDPEMFEDIPLDFSYPVTELYLSKYYAQPTPPYSTLIFEQYPILDEQQQVRYVTGSIVVNNRGQNHYDLAQQRCVDLSIINRFLSKGTYDHSAVWPSFVTLTFLGHGSTGSQFDYNVRCLLTVHVHCVYA